jgi:hypothetical protein
MGTALTVRQHTRPATAAPASPPGDGGRRAFRRRRIAVAAAFTGSMLAFGLHLCTYGSWIVDDAGISMAYGMNLARGVGLVAQPGTPPVEAFSNPSWVALLAVLTKAGLLGRGELLGVASYVVVTKGLAMILHGVVLVAMAVVIHRVIVVARGGSASFGVWLTCWLGAGVLLAANPSYAVWMGSGLENPLMAALAACLAAGTVRALPRPSSPVMACLGTLSGLAAVTRPDGAIYGGVVVAVALLATRRSFADRARLVGWGLLPFVTILGSYLVFRRTYFGAWLPNTAVAKEQGLPTPADLGRLATMVSALGWLLVAIAVAGALAAGWTTWRRRDRTAWRVFTGGGAVLGAAVATFVVLPSDWMEELRFLTPAWPLWSAAAALGIAQLASLGRSPKVRRTIAALLTLLGALVLPSWIDRAGNFRAHPTVPLCVVAIHYGSYFERAARVLDVDPARASVLLPDIGGVLLASEFEVVDLAGLADPKIARLIRDGDADALARHILTDLRPTFIHVHGDWIPRTGFDERSHALVAGYSPLDGTENWVRRDVLARADRPDDVAARLARGTEPIDATNPRRSCPQVLFG